jgi:hypothetical protein
MLIEGQSLTLPSGVMASGHSASTFKPYDPAAALGDTSPTSAKPGKRAKCGVVGQIISMAIAVAVTALTGMPELGNIAGQLFNMATGMQHGFNWKSLGMTVVTSGITQGIDGSGAFNFIGNTFLREAASGMAANALSQGIGVATGLQNKFSWSSVAAAGVISGVSGALGKEIGARSLSDNHSIANQMKLALVSSVGGLAGAATRSLITGTNFGDNVMAVLPDVIASTIGNMMAGAAQGGGSKGTAEPVGVTESSGPQVNTQGLLSVPEVAFSPESLLGSAGVSAWGGIAASAGGTASSDLIPLMDGGTGNIVSNILYLRDNPELGGWMESTYLANEGWGVRGAYLDLRDKAMTVERMQELVSIVGGLAAQDSSRARTAQLRDLLAGELGQQLANSGTVTAPARLAGSSRIEAGYGESAWNFVVGTATLANEAVEGAYSVIESTAVLGYDLTVSAFGGPLGDFQFVRSANARLYDRFDTLRNTTLLDLERPFAESFDAAVLRNDLRPFARLSGGLAMGELGAARLTVSLGSPLRRLEPAGERIPNLTERGTLTNLAPHDPILLQGPARTLVQDGAGRYWLQSATGKRITPSGSYDFVTMPDGAIRVARTNPNGAFSTHLGLSGGREVSYAGSIRFANGNTATRGTIRSWSNNSGHYMPPASFSGNANLPSNLFTPH